MYKLEVTIQPIDNRPRYTEVREFGTLEALQTGYKDAMADRQVLMYEVL